MAGPPEAVELDTQPQEAHLWDYVHVVLRRRRLALAILVGITALAALRTFLTRPVYEAVAQIQIQRENPNVLTFKEVAQVDAARDDYYQTQYKLLQSRALARRVVESMGLMQDPEYGGPRPEQDVAAALAQPPGQSPLVEGVVNTLLSRLRVQPVRNSQLVSVAVESYRPELSAQIANRLAQLFIRQTLEFRFQTSSDAGQWLGDQIEDQKKKVEVADLALQKVKEREGIVNIEERRTLLEQKLKELGTALTTLKTTRLEREALYNQMRTAPNPEELPEVMRSPLVQSLRIELANLERQQAQLQERYLDQHPEVVKVRNQIQETRSKIRSESQRVIRAAENDYKAAAAQEASVHSALEAAKAETLELARRSVQYDTLKRDLDASKEVLASLLSRHKQTDVAQELKSSNIRVVDQAVVPRTPVRPKKLRDLLLGLMLGLGAGIGVAFFLDYLDNTLKTPDDVRVHLGAPLLGVIPELAESNKSPLVTHSRSQGPFIEGYRVVRTALNYSWPDVKPRVVIVTSTAPGEGKTLTSVNLALTLAATEGQVLLIDGDLRKPQVHAFLGGKKTPGLSDILVGKAKPSESIQHQAGTHLSFLSAGRQAPSPGDILINRTLRGFLDGLKQIYAWIVIDTPPVGAVAEALTLAPLADGVVVVAGAEMVPRKAVAHTLERLQASGGRILGIVLNRAQVEKHSYYYGHYYGHYYGRYQQPAEDGKVARINERRAKR
ncbi:MAG TPA: polysaccharide biosynthesis tyrosine autokinase [Vicinamibacteria bacterium]|nr:polysaccharide biosynthesis tyrosine autokinase [Vicinamibacteria bacterium]